MCSGVRCTCDKYISMNSDKGIELVKKLEKEYNAYVKGFGKEFAERNDFK